MGARIERVLEANGRFIGWWAQKIESWSRSRQRGVTGWIIHELTWIPMIFVILAFYAYLAFTFIAAWTLQLWYISIPGLIIGYLVLSV